MLNHINHMGIPSPPLKKIDGSKLEDKISFVKYSEETLYWMKLFNAILGVFQYIHVIMHLFVQDCDLSVNCL